MSNYKPFKKEMKIEEANKVLEELYEVGPEKLNDKAKRLFEAIMTIADERDSVKADLYEANNRINDLLDLVKQKDKRIAVEEIQEQYFISKDKIKEILEIEEKIDNEKLLSLLQTIVDENARLEDIEDRKVQIEYNNVFNKGVKSVEDKIKAKIEEVKDGTYDAKIVLQSLLEKE